MHSIQADLFETTSPTKDAVAYFSDSDAASRGAIHTKPEVAEFILDLMGWDGEADLTGSRLLEPSVGEGDFLVPAVRRLLRQSQPNDLSISGSIRAVEVSLSALAICRERMHELLGEHGWSRPTADVLLDQWLVHADFLTVPLAADFSHIVGNPPYLRLEDLPKDLLRLYRGRWPSLFDRADLYVAFIEKSLGLLRTEGRLGFICADRWMKNRYGGPLRAMVTESYHMDTYVDFTGCPAFFDEVDAYPAVTIIRRGPGKVTRVAFRPEVNAEVLRRLAQALRGRAEHAAVSVCTNSVRGESPWSFDELGYMDLLRGLEQRLPAMEEAGVRVGIGVATGADAVFIGHNLDVEDSRKLPLVTTRDIRSGRVEWQGRWVLNPFEDDGTVVDLRKYPRFAAYVEKHRDSIAGRNVAARTPHAWYRTIDRIHATLTSCPKLLIPDIKGSAHVVFEEGKLYPHHNLYHITSGTWDLHALQAVLSSRVAFAFVSAYSPRMRGGHLRFQAQYLRRICIPCWADVSEKLRSQLSIASLQRDQTAMDDAVRELYGFTYRDWTRLAPTGATVIDAS
ncbi:MAG: Eco57I restriction-modification methylase domain-containing protein [Opitutaceae bacterium]|nr:Eco57I restriction-modification methylase domain-containing protein [Opitutaceae bacterium]